METEQAIIDWLRKDVGAELIRMRLAAGMPGGTAHQRAKQRAMLDGMDHAHKSILEALERGDHRAAKRGL